VTGSAAGAAQKQQAAGPRAGAACGGDPGCFAVGPKATGGSRRQTDALEVQLAAQQAELATALSHRRLVQLFVNWRQAAQQQQQEKRRGAMMYLKIRSATAITMHQTLCTCLVPVRWCHLAGSRICSTH
jgi:hypothetical protein